MAYPFIQDEPSETDRFEVWQIARLTELLGAFHTGKRLSFDISEGVELADLIEVKE